YELNDHKLKRIGADEPPLPKKDKNSTAPKNPAFQSGLFLDAEARTLYSLDINAGTITAHNLDSDEARTEKCGGRPYDVVRGRNGAQLYVSDWAGRAVLVLDPKSLRVVARIAVGEHPNQMIVHPKDDRLFVACASSNCVSVLD